MPKQRLRAAAALQGVAVVGEVHLAALRVGVEGPAAAGAGVTPAMKKRRSGY